MRDLKVKKKKNPKGFLTTFSEVQNVHNFPYLDLTLRLTHVRYGLV